jgi:hypothetical protein
MDTSETYIKMCEKAEEIQKLSAYAYKIDVESTPPIVGIDNNYYITNDKLIWLPRQDQLQGMSGLTWQGFDIACLKYNSDTKEQASIQVVYKEKYNKVWNGEEWTSLKA